MATKRKTGTARRSPARRAAPAPRESVARYEQAMRAINEGVYDWDIARGTIHYSEGVYSVLKMPRSMKTVADWRSRIHPEDLPAFTAAITAHLKGETRRFECDYRFRAADGNWRWARSHGIAQRDRRRRAVRMVGSTGDITELKRIEQALKESEQRYALATQAATEGIYDWNIETGELYLSQQAKAFFAVGRGALTPKAWNERIHPEDYPGYRQAVIACFKGLTPQIELEYRMRNAAGSYAWVVDRGVAVRNEAGRAIRLVGALSDVTQRKLQEIELRRAHDETAEALERQTATAEILKVIASSPSDVQPVFDTIVKNALALCKGMYANVFRYDGEVLHFMATESLAPRGVELMKAKYPMRPDASQASGRVILGKAVVRIEDVSRDPDYDPRLIVSGGPRRMLAVPMLREGTPLGVVVVAWGEPGPVSKHHEELLRTFADQAVIAIENVRLFNETREALERQTATAEILKVIASSPSDVQPVFDAIARSALRLIGGNAASVTQLVGDMLHLAAFTATSEAGNEALKSSFPRPLSSPGLHTTAARSRRPAYSSDFESDSEVPELKGLARARGNRSQLTVPMLREGVSIGTIAVTRAEPGQFSSHQISLMETFADQAVIAIENVRLFNETKEALERQTATAEILKVISSSPTDVQPVFDVIAAHARRLLGGLSSAVIRIEGDMLTLAALTSTDEVGDKALRNMFPRRLSQSGGNVLRAVSSRAPNFVSDIEADSALSEEYRAMARARGFRSVIAAPMLARGGEAIGVISVTRQEPGPFSEHQLGLLKTFADQAVIAIENVRLFNETKEALERQTATAEILRVIAQSPADVQPVFDALVEKAVQLCGAQTGMIFRREANMMRLDAAYGAREAFVEYVRQHGVPLDRRTVTGRTGVEGRTVHVLDVQNDPEYSYGGQAIESYRSMLGVPLMREGEPIGTFSVWRHHVEAFTPRQIALIEIFAAQAVIAIENVRLFNELKARTAALTRSVGQLTALGEVGQAVSSTLDLETVLKTIVSRAVQLTGLHGGTIYEYDAPGGVFHLRAAEGMPEELAEVYRRMPIRLGEGVVGGAAARREPVQVPDIQDPGYQTRYRELLLRQGYRAILAVPLLRDDQIIGALTVSRNEPGAFAPEAVELLKTFATQSALAIQNARLFREIAEKGRQLEVASHHKSQFLASMSHELRTPLNAILGFNEMILGDVYGEVPPDMRPALEQTQTSGKHLLRLINNVLDLAKIEAGRMELALADYAVQDVVTTVRSTLQPLAAEKGLEFVATVPADVPLAHGDAGRITQCLMNLAGNSLKFTKQGKVEIAVGEKDGLLTYRVSDTGIGIPPDKIASLFTEFKQTDASIASEYGGTGLGLSITKKFIEMHGGRIWVESEPGKGSSFIFEVPLRVQGA